MSTRLFGTQPYITIVSGLPRSGTSLMMRMLEAGGMEVMVDHLRQPDEDNPYGYYELEQAKKIKADASFLDNAHGKAFKMVSMLLSDLPNDKQYKIVFMKRHLGEVLASQRIMLQRSGKSVQEDDDIEMRRIFQKHLHEIASWLAEQQNMAVIYVNYNDLMQHPLASAKAVNRFLGNRLDVRKMAAVVDQRLYRNKAFPD